MPYQQVTLATLRQELKDEYESVPFWLDSEATTALNESLRVWNLLTGYWKRREIIPTVAGQVWYPLTSSMVYGVRVAFCDYPLEVSSIHDLDNGRPNWEAHTTATGGIVPTRPWLFAPAGLFLIAIWPADAAGGNTLVVDSVRQTPVLTLDADFVDLNQSEHRPLLQYALHYLAFKEGGRRFEATKAYYQRFLLAAGDMNQLLRASTWFRKEMGLDLGRIQRPPRAAKVGVPAQ